MRVCWRLFCGLLLTLAFCAGAWRTMCTHGDGLQHLASVWCDDAPTAAASIPSAHDCPCAAHAAQADSALPRTPATPAPDKHHHDLIPLLLGLAMGGNELLIALTLLCLSLLLPRGDVLHMVHRALGTLGHRCIWTPPPIPPPAVAAVRAVIRHC